jgi:hypothetical protein
VHEGDTGSNVQEMTAVLATVRSPIDHHPYLPEAFPHYGPQVVAALKVDRKPPHSSQSPNANTNKTPPITNSETDESGSELPGVDGRAPLSRRLARQHVPVRDLPVMRHVEGRASIWHTGRGPTALPGELFGPWLQASASS